MVIFEEEKKQVRSLAGDKSPPKACDVGHLRCAFCDIGRPNIPTYLERPTNLLLTYLGR